MCDCFESYSFPCLFFVVCILVLFSFQVVVVCAFCFLKSVMGVLPVSVSCVVCLRSVDGCLYERSAMAVAKAIGFDAGSVACLGLPRLFSDRIYEIIRSRCVCGDDILF